ncbi:MAG TPA: hypothetical protein VFC44_00825, partial [Candidatus Saccharimonadales bacterium]|nr:hypothetical protein [Candidatus Saccharimonadales bacterium]
WKSSEDEWFIRGKVLEALALPPSHLMFCLSHTHAGPSIFRADAVKPGGQFVGPYLRQLQRKAVQTAQRALAKAVPATLAWRYGKCDLAANRDLPEQGKKRFVVGYNPAEKADDTLLAGRVMDKNGRSLATLVNYACHPTTLAWDNKLISPDYVGAMREVVEAQTHAPCLFLQGASGELAPAEQYVGNLAVAEAHGRRLGYAVLGTLEGLLPPATGLSFAGVVESGAALGIWERSAYRVSTALSSERVEVALPLKPLPSLAEIEERWRECADRVFKERLGRQRAVRQAVGEGKSARTHVWVWRLGDALLVGQPNEAYSQFQQKLRRQMEPNPVAVLNLVNGSIGYLPPRPFCGRDLYPVWQTPFAAGALELLTRTASKCAQRMMKS